MRRQKLLQSIAGKTLYMTLLSVALVVIHTFISISAPIHAAQSKSFVNAQASDSRSCAQQCSPNTSEPRLLTQENKDEDDSPTPFALLLASLGGAVSLVYTLPALIKFVRRKLKIPIYKQVACFRI